MTDISVLIGTRNQRAILERVLGSFGRQTLPATSFEVIVVDSDSSDGTHEVCAPARWPFAVRMLRKANEGKVAARNLAIREARSPVVLLTDGDVVAHPELLARHIEAQRRHPGAAIVGRQVIVDDPANVGPSGRSVLRSRRAAGQRLRWDELVTGNASLPLQTLLDAGMFDEDFRGYGYEDYELGYRLTARGVDIVFEPRAINYHYHPVGFADELLRKREAGRSAVVFCRKHPSRRLRWQLGLHPLNRLIWERVREQGWIARAWRRRAAQPPPRGRLARALLLELEFQRGAQEVFKES